MFSSSTASSYWPHATNIVRACARREKTRRIPEALLAVRDQVSPSQECSLQPAAVAFSSRHYTVDKTVDASQIDDVAEQVLLNLLVAHGI